MIGEETIKGNFDIERRGRKEINKMGNGDESIKP